MSSASGNNGLVATHTKKRSKKIGKSWTSVFYVLGLIPTAVAFIQVGANFAASPASSRLGLFILPIGTGVSFMCGKAIGYAQKNDCTD